MGLQEWAVQLGEVIPLLISALNWVTLHFLGHPQVGVVLQQAQLHPAFPQK